MAKTPAWVGAVKDAKACTHCGETKGIDSFYTTGKTVSGAPKYNSWCKGCISKKQADYHKRVWGKEQLQYAAFKRTKNVRAYLQYLRGKATQRRKREEVISLDALELLWNAQNGLCALTQWPMTMELANGVVHTNCSIDRIDSSLGYVVGNVQLVCRAANVAKSNLTSAEFLALCNAVAKVANNEKV